MKSDRTGLRWIPNAFTAGNLALGALSILTSLDAHLRPVTPAPGIPGPFDVACWLILWASILDVLDGKVAKLTGATSEFGMRLDTFADATSFGLAPAVLIYCTFLSPANLPQPWGWIACGAYFAAAAFRLARYNVISTAGGFGFVGLPTPAAALISVSLFLSTHRAPLPSWVYAAFMALVGLVMVSPLPYPSFKGLYPREKKVMLGIMVAGAIATLLVGPAQVILAVFGSYALIWGYWWVPSRSLWVPELKERA